MMDDARNIRLLGDIATIVRENSDDLASGWVELIRPVIGDIFPGDDLHRRTVAVLETLADLLDGEPYDSYSNYLRRLFIDLTSTGLTISWILDTRDLFIEYLVTFIASGLEPDEERADDDRTGDYRAALTEFANGNIGFLALRDLALAGESQISDAQEKSIASGREREILLEISSSLHLALSQRDVFTGLLPELIELIPGAQAGVVMLFNESESLKIADVFNLEDFQPVKSEVNLDGSIYSDVLEAGEEKIFNRSNVSKSMDFIFRRASTVGEKVLRVPPLSVVVIPVVLEKDCIGGIAFFNYSREGSFTQDDLFMLRVVNRQLTLALERVLYSEKASRQLKRIRTVLEIAKSLKTGQTPREVSETMLGAIRKAIDFTRGAIYHLTSDGSIVPTGVIDIEAPLDVRQINFPEDPASIFVLALQREEIIHIEDLSDPGPFDPTSLPEPVKGVSTGSLIVAPLVIDEDPVGLLLMYHREPHAFDDEEIDLIKVICQQGAHFLLRSIDYDRFIKTLAITREEQALSQRMQRGLSPSSFHSGRWEIQISLLQGNIFGGDFTIVRPTARGFMASIGDVCGRGQAAGMIMMRTYGMINEIYDPEKGPDSIFETLNNIIIKQFEGGGKGIASHCFVTCAMVNARGKGIVSVASAGIPPIFLYRHATGDVFELEQRGIPLGISQDMNYLNNDLGLAPGDKLLLYTGGLVTGRDATGVFFGPNELKELFKKAARFPARVILGIIEGALPEIDNKREYDDRAAMVISLADPNMKDLSFNGKLDEAEAACETVLRALKRRVSTHETIFSVKLALHEVVKNAIEHGNKGDTSLDVHLRYLLGEDFLHMVVRDSGEGFDLAMLRMRGSASILKDKGRGLMMVKQLMDKIWLDPDTGEINLFIRFTVSEEKSG